MRRSVNSRQKQRGAAIVETVVVSPLLLFLVLATAEVTNAFVDHTVLTKSVRAAARHVAGNAILGTTGIVQLQPALVTQAQNLVVFGNATGTGTAKLSGLSAANVQVQDLGNNTIQVTATYTYDGIFGGTIVSLGLGGDISTGSSLSATVTMRAL
jgi:Flp pilus assembly protein TadG